MIPPHQRNSDRYGLKNRGITLGIVEQLLEKRNDFQYKEMTFEKKRNKGLSFGIAK